MPLGVVVFRCSFLTLAEALSYGRSYGQEADALALGFGILLVLGMGDESTGELAEEEQRDVACREWPLARGAGPLAQITLHRWRALMRLVLRAWRGWHALLAAAVARRHAALQSRADRLCSLCLFGWVEYVQLRWRAKAGLVHYATTLQQRCLSAWAGWLAHRKRKAPERARLLRLATQKSLSGAWRKWTTVDAGSSSRSPGHPNTRKRSR